MTKRNTEGFTIVELMISTVVLSVLLLIASTAIVGLSRQFYKGINQSKVQEVTRTISDELVAAIQFSADGPRQIPDSGAPVGWCVGEQRYLFVKGKKLAANPSSPGPNESSYVLARDGECAAGATCTDSSPLPCGAQEIIGHNMRLIEFNIIGDSLGEVFSVNTTVGMGDDDLFCSPTIANSCDNGAPALSAAQLASSSDLLCKGQVGSQYCAVSRSTVTVVKRL